MKILKAKTVITGDGKTIIENGAIVVNDKGLIEKVAGQAVIEEKYPNNEVFDYGDATILPGLIDTHVHIGYWQTKSDKDIYNGHTGLITLLAVEELQQALSLGVTTIRTVTEPKDQAYCLKMAYSKGFIKGPRYITSNVGISCTGGHGTQVPGMIIEANGPYEFREAVREQIKTGADWIKLLASHRTHMCEITQEELNAAVDETHRWQKKCCIHAGSEISIESSIKAGVDTIEHGTFMTVEQAKIAKDKGIAWVPTIIAYYSGYQFMKQIVESESIQSPHKLIINENYTYFKESTNRYKEYFKQIADTGIKIATGTDIVFETMPITPVSDEIKLMTEFGMNTLQAIQCGTSSAAEILDLGDTIGLLKEGYIADILVINGNAAEDITTLKNVAEVFKDGETVYKK